MIDEPRFAEEIIDLRTVSELFQGEEFELTTGRVALHAIGADGRVFCGRAGDELSPIAQLWDAGYLPHLPRCLRCSAAVLAGKPGPVLDPETYLADPLPAGLPAAGVDVRTAHGTDGEKAGADALRAVLAEHDLRRWMFTDLVTVNEELRGGVSHPLMISPALLVRRPACALTTFLHEQCHWIQCPGLDTATTEASERWPEPPLLPTGGHDTESTWLHISVCGLEYLSLREVLGPAAAQEELRQHHIYSWIYEQILADTGWLEDFLDRHEVRVPAAPPVPRRYHGSDWYSNLV